MKKGVKIFLYGLFFIISILPAFFIVFNSVFSDGGSFGERLFTFVLVICAYGILGFVLGYFVKGEPWKMGLWISLPAIIIVGLYSINEYTRLLLHLFYVALTIGSAVCGSYFGGSLGSKKH